MKRPERIADLESRLEQLREKNRLAEEQLKARKARLESAEKAKARKLRTRRLILMGTCLEDMQRTDSEVYERFLARLERFLRLPRDRELFGWEPRADA